MLVHNANNASDSDCTFGANKKGTAARPVNLQFSVLQQYLLTVRPPQDAQAVYVQFIIAVKCSENISAHADYIFDPIRVFQIRLQAVHHYAVIDSFAVKI